MRIVLLALLLAVAPALAETPSAPASPPPTGSVVFEVFSSQGCSNCPPSDRVMTLLSEKRARLDPGIVPLEFHVPFYDDGPWKDPFSTFRWAQRARKYQRRLGLETLYTPWMVVNGRHQQGALDSTARLRKVLRTHRLPDVAELEVKARHRAGEPDKEGKPTPGHIQLQVGARLHTPVEARRLTVFMALVEHGFRTPIPGGDNKGKTIENAWVVREYAGVLYLRPRPGRRRRIDYRLPVQPGWKAEKLGLAAIIQDPDSGRIFQGRRFPIEGP